MVRQTPCLDDGSLQQDGLRRREALAYLERSVGPNRPWCALDDRMNLWYPMDSRIIYCPDQFGEREGVQLRGFLDTQPGENAFRENS